MRSSTPKDRPAPPIRPKPGRKNKTAELENRILALEVQVREMKFVYDQMMDGGVTVTYH